MPVKHRKCSNCQQVGHNARTCDRTEKKRLCRLCSNETGSRESETCQFCYDITREKEVVRPLHCGICGMEGHNMRTCHERAVRALLLRQG